MKIGLMQYDPVWEDKQANREKLEALLSDAEVNVSLLIFPEMSLTGFTMSSLEHAEELDGESVKFFGSVAQRFECHVMAGLIEQATPLPYNSLVHVLPDGSVAAVYRKVHTISYYDEDAHYQNGTTPTVTSVEGAEIGLSVCFDLRFPELYRSYVDQAVVSTINIANWPASRIHHWTTLLRARAIENQCYMVGVNRIGTGDNVQYNGHSAVFTPLGEELISAGEVEGVFTAELSQQTVESVQESFPVLNRRVLNT